jgi:hypothetical protein
VVLGFWVPPMSPRRAMWGPGYSRSVCPTLLPPLRLGQPSPMEKPPPTPTMADRLNQGGPPSKRWMGPSADEGDEGRRQQDDE